MEILRELKRQMRVVTNPQSSNGEEDYHLCFVGVGRRRQPQSGWWKTKLNYYSLDVVSFKHRLRIGGQEIQREKNTVALYAPHVVYEEYYDAPREFEDAWILFKGREKSGPLFPLLRKNKGHAFFKDPLQRIPALIREAAGIADVDIASRWRAKAAFFQILALLCESKPDGDLHTLTSRAEGIQKLRGRVLEILQADPRKDFSVDDIARKLGVSRSSFTHRFSREAGETWVELKNRFRIGRAQMLIGETEKSLKEIAYEIGFEDPAYFSRIFQNVTGLSPKKYRRLLFKNASIS